MIKVSEITCPGCEDFQEISLTLEFDATAKDQFILAEAYCRLCDYQGKAEEFGITKSE
jgi:hypothetical protein